MALKFFILKTILVIYHILRSLLYFICMSQHPFCLVTLDTFLPSWRHCIQKSDGICLIQASRAFVCFQRLHLNTAQISQLISAKISLGSVFPLINIWAGRRSWQDNSGIQVSEHNLRPRSSAADIIGLQGCFRKALLHSWYHLAPECNHAKSLLGCDSFSC